MIGIITYDNPHRKTQDVLNKLFLKGYKNIDLIIIPWVSRKSFEPVFKHRPSFCENISTEVLCERLELTFTRVEIDDLDKHCSRKNYSHILISGAGILPDSLCRNHKVINAHPGFLPYSKGLDAFKWAIYNNHPIGVTTHFISDKADEGILIEKREVTVYFEDSFGSVSQRIYETEIDMLAESIKILDNNQAPLDDLSDDQYKATRRMPHHYEIIMMEKFNELRKASKSTKQLN